MKCFKFNETTDSRIYSRKKYGPENKNDDIGSHHIAESQRKLARFTESPGVRIPSMVSWNPLLQHTGTENLFFKMPHLSVGSLFLNLN